MAGVQAELPDVDSAAELASLASWDKQFALRRMTVPDLRLLAKQQGITNISKMRKKELISVLEKALGLSD